MGIDRLVIVTQNICVKIRGPPSAMVVGIRGLDEFNVVISNVEKILDIIRVRTVL